MIIIDYKTYVLLGPLWTRNLMFEKIISQDAEYAFAYANWVLESRWLQGEKAIKTDWYVCNKYIADILKVNLSEGRKLLNIV